MAILRADLPVTEEALMADGLIADRCRSRYTLLHGREFKGELSSASQNIGFSSELTASDCEVPRLIIWPNQQIYEQRELIVRSVAASTMKTTLRRYYIPDDPEFIKMDFELGAETAEVTYGCPKAVTAYNAQTGLIEPGSLSGVSYLRSVLWVEESDSRAAIARSFHDEWSE